MSNQTIHDSEHDEIFTMLPWYVNQTLEPSQRGSVSRHVQHCEECQREVQFLASLNETVQSESDDHYHMHSDVEKSLASVMGRIDAESGQTKTVTSWPSMLIQKIENLFSFSIALPNAQWGATAVAGLLVAVLGFQWYSGQTDDDYSVLSSSDMDNASMRLSFELTSSADSEQVEAFIQDEFEKLGQVIEVEPDANGRFIVSLKEAVSVSELNDIVVGLENEDWIRRVELLP